VARAGEGREISGVSQSETHESRRDADTRLGYPTTFSGQQFSTAKQQKPRKYDIFDSPSLAAENNMVFLTTKKTTENNMVFSAGKETAEYNYIFNGYSQNHQN
jgi:hypothetical protein